MDGLTLENHYVLLDILENKRLEAHRLIIGRFQLDGLVARDGRTLTESGRVRAESLRKHIDALKSGVPLSWRTEDFAHEAIAEEWTKGRFGFKKHPVWLNVAMGCRANHFKERDVFGRYHQIFEPGDQVKQLWLEIGERLGLKPGGVVVPYAYQTDGKLNGFKAICFKHIYKHDKPVLRIQAKYFDFITMGRKAPLKFSWIAGHNNPLRVNNARCTGRTFGSGPYYNALILPLDTNWLDPQVPITIDERYCLIPQNKNRKGSRNKRIDYRKKKEE